MNTNIKVKEKYYPVFTNEIWKRMEKGRTKYSLPNPNKEGTDIADEVVENFNIGDIIKYLVEYTNTTNPKCLYDAAGMCFIRWLRDYEKYDKKTK